MNGLMIKGFIIPLIIEIDNNTVAIYIDDTFNSIWTRRILTNIKQKVKNGQAVIAYDTYADYTLKYAVELNGEYVGAHPNVKLELYKNDEDENYTLWFKFEGQGVGVDFETQIDAAEIEGDNIFFIEKQTFAVDIYSTR